MSKELSISNLILRNGSASEWTSSNPVLLAGEMGVELQSDGTYKIKIGDGVKNWIMLPYVSVGSTASGVNEVYIGSDEPTDGSKLWIKI